MENNGKEILKPMSIAREEFIISLTDLINNCMLPPFVIEAILKDMYGDIRVVSKRQLEIDKQRYQEQISENVGVCPDEDM